MNYRILPPRRRSRRVTLTVTPANEVIVRAPLHFPRSEIEKFVADHSSWIRKVQDRNLSRPRPQPKRFTDGETHLFLGRQYQLKLLPDSDCLHPEVSLLPDQLCIRYPSALSLTAVGSLVPGLLLKWYLASAREHITARADYFAARLGVAYSRLAIKQVTTLWGSCSSAGNLSFNRSLILAPLEIVDYVVIHELCHLVHANHGARFWHLVSSLDPEHKSHRLWLRHHRHLMVL